MRTKKKKLKFEFFIEAALMGEIKVATQIVLT